MLSLEINYQKLVSELLELRAMNVPHSIPASHSHDPGSRQHHQQSCPQDLAMPYSSGPLSNTSNTVIKDMNKMYVLLCSQLSNVHFLPVNLSIVHALHKLIFDALKV